MRTSITNKLVLYFILFAIVVGALTSVSLYQYAKASMNERVYFHLDSVSHLKKNNLDVFFEGIQMVVVGLSNDYHLKDHLIDDDYSFNYALWYHLDNSRGLAIEEIFLLDKQGVIFASSNNDSVGKIRDMELYFREGELGLNSQYFFYDIGSNEPSVVISAPVFDENGMLLAVVAAKVNLDYVSHIMSHREGLGETGETLLVNSFNSLMSESRFEEGSEFALSVHTESVQRCLQRETGYGEFLDYRDVPVFVKYMWIEDQQVCMISKIDKSETMEDLIKLRTWLIIINLISFVLAAIVAFFLAHSITHPIMKLVDASKFMAKGDFDKKVVIETGDELEYLGDVFNNVAKSLKKTQELQKHYEKELKSEVKHRTKELQKTIKEVEQSKEETLRLMDELQAAFDKQKQLERVKTEFLSVTSHELRTPITPIKAQLQMVLGGMMGELNEKQKKSLNMVLTNATRLDRLIGDILDISKMQSGVMKLIWEDVDLNEVMDHVLETMKLKADTKNVNLTLEQDPVDKLRLDKDRIIQVVVNLVNNAIKFTPEKGSIHMRMKKENDHVTISVKDTGIGISSDDIERIFNPFEQVDSSFSRHFEGSGLGLAISKGIVQTHGGKIWVESTPNKGSTFFFTLPFKSQEHKEKNIEIFSFDKKKTLLSFTKIAYNDGYKLVTDKSDDLIAEDLIDEDGTLKPGTSYDELEKKGFIEKRGEWDPCPIRFD